MYYVEIYKDYRWIAVFKFMCKSIANYYADIIHKEDKYLTKTTYFYEI